MAAIAAAYAYGVPADIIEKALSDVQVSGRMEQYTSQDGKRRETYGDCRFCP